MPFAPRRRACSSRPQRCVVIEDAYKGVVAATDAGCACIAFPHDYTVGNDFSRARIVIGSLDEVTVELGRGSLDRRSVHHDRQS